MKSPFKKEDGAVKKRCLVCGCASIAIGFVLIVVGVLAKYVIVDIVVEEQAYLSLDLKEGTEQYDAWVRKWYRIIYYGSGARIRAGWHSINLGFYRPRVTTGMPLGLRSVSYTHLTLPTNREV